MKCCLKLFSIVLMLVLYGCSASVPKPDKGPVANLDVVGVNFSPDRSIVSNIENLWVELSSNDGTWSGNYVLKQGEPEKAFVIPANKNVKMVLNVMQGGYGFDSSCGASLDIKPEEHAKLRAEFEFYRETSGKVITGCDIRLYSGSKLVDTYSGGANITKYVIKFLY